MIFTRERHRSLVIPKWTSISNINDNQENISPRESSFSINTKTTESLKKDYEEFIKNPSTLSATELMNSAFVINNFDIARELALFIIKNSDKHSKLTLELAYYIVSDSKNSMGLWEYDLKKIRKYLHQFPKNPLLWAELGRLYTIRGLKEKARRSIMIALQLAPYNRFIIRSSFRFFVHTDDIDQAAYYVKKAVDYSPDPLLRSLEINAAILNDMNLNRIKKLNKRLIPERGSYLNSELIESYGMVELNLGNENKAKQNFRIAWEEPTDNVISHAEWIIRNKFPNMERSAEIDFNRSKEAITIINLYQLKLSEAIITGKEWIFEEPYSSHPYLVCSSILNLDQKPLEAISILKEGIISNPGHLGLLNNLAYSFINSKSYDLAEKILDSYPSNMGDHDKIFYLATKGLLSFKKGLIDIGREYYKKSMELSQKAEEPFLFQLALIHYLEAEYENNENSFDFIENALKLITFDDNPTIKIKKEKLEKKIDFDKKLKAN